jgi:hypothetical protein
VGSCHFAVDLRSVPNPLLSRLNYKATYKFVYKSVYIDHVFAHLESQESCCISGVVKTIVLKNATPTLLKYVPRQTIARVANTLIDAKVAGYSHCNV